MKVLGIETSCDDTSVGIVEDGWKILGESTHSQIQTHRRFGGIVPEIAAREHFEFIDEVVFDALDQAELSLGEIDRIAVTYAPGLMSSLLVGVTAAKAMSALTNIPIVAVHHLRAHICAIQLNNPQLVEFPFVCLLASGGHTQILYVSSFEEMKLLGGTLDDSAGEAFDKVARLLGLPYPGGPEIEKLAKCLDFDCDVVFPMPKVGEFDFSFSGLKTFALRKVQALSQEDELSECQKIKIAYAFQERACSELSRKLIAAATKYNCQNIVISGGVAANSRLRSLVQAHELNVIAPDLRYCMDNGAMIASAGYHCPDVHGMDFDIKSRQPL